MRNYRELSDEEILELERLYPVTPNRELSRRFDISVDAIHDRLAYPRGWKKNMKALRIGNRGGHRLTEREEVWIVRHYQHTKNEDIMRKFGIGESSLHRIARKHGLKKSRQFIKKINNASNKASIAVCREYGVYKKNAELARSQWEERKYSGNPHSVGFQKGQSNKTRFSKKRFGEIIAKSTATRRETVRKERMRIRWGLPQKTKMKLVGGGRKRTVYKYLFKKHNYIVELGSTDIYYDDLTNRSPRMEANAHKYGLTVREAEE